MTDTQIIILMISIAGLATGLGALPILFTEDISQRALDTLLGFAAGVMLAATAYSLILPAINHGGGDLKSVLIASGGIILGGVFLEVFDKLLPHVHIDERKEGRDSQMVTGIWLFVIAIALHNFPEGLATGVGFGTGNISDGVAISAGIALQNVPEGLAVAISLLKAGYSKKFSIIVSFLTGLIEPVAAGLGILLVNLFQPLLGLILAMAGGAMLYVISDEIIPTTHSGGYEKEATYGIMVGFVTMIIMDFLLG